MSKEVNVTGPGTSATEFMGPAGTAGIGVTACSFQSTVSPHWDAYTANEDAVSALDRVNALRKKLKMSKISLPHATDHDADWWRAKTAILEAQERSLFQELAGKNGSVRASYRGSFGWYTDGSDYSVPQLGGGETASEWFEGMDGHDVEVIVIDHGPAKP